MSSKICPGLFDSYVKALPDEPYFMLLARDKTAPAKIRQWADEKRGAVISEFGASADALRTDPSRQAEYRHEMEKCRDADMIAHDMEDWRALNDGAWREDSARHELDDINPALRDAIAEEVKRSVCSLLATGTASVVLRDHIINAWSMPGFAIRRHYFRLESESKFEKLADQTHPVLPDFHISGFDVSLGDVLCKYKSDSDIRLEIQIVGLGHSAFSRKAYYNDPTS
jgi:hypothetical protein